MRESERVALARTILDLAGGDACEAIVTSSASGLTRFTHNAVHQNLASADTTVRVRTIVDGRTGVAVTNDLGSASLAQTVARARAIAAFAPADVIARALLHTAPIPAPHGAFVAATAAASPTARAATVAAIVTEAEAASVWAAGYVTTSQTGITIANSTGTLLSFDGTACGLNVKANAADATGFAERYANDVAALDGAAAGAIAVAKTRVGTAPIAVDPGAWTVILEPAAIGELLSYLTDHFSAQTYVDGASFLADGLGRTYVGENVTVWDDHTHPFLADLPFDFEGAPRTRVPLFEAGVANHVVTDARYAQKLGIANTGHGFAVPSASGPEPRSVVVSTGSRSTQDLIAQTKRGLLVSRFWYIRPVDERKTIVTGMTRDGTFLIEDGKITAGVRNMRFNQSILEALRHCEFASEAERTEGYGYRMVVPAVKIEGFHFDSRTDF